MSRLARFVFIRMIQLRSYSKSPSDVRLGAYGEVSGAKR